MYWEIGSIQINPSYRLLDGCYVVDLYLSYDKSNNVIWDKLENQGSIIQENSELSLSKKTICIHNVPTSYSYHNGFIKTRNVLNNQKKALSNYLLHKHTENNSQSNIETTSSSQLLNNFNPGGFVSQKDYSKWLTPVGIKEVEAIRSVRVITYRYQTKEGNYEIALEVTLKRDYQWSNLDGIVYPYQIKDDNQILIRVPTSLSHTQLLLDLSQLDCLKKQAMDADILAKYARLHYLDDNQNIKPLFLTDWLEALKITAKNYSRIQNIHVDHLDNDSVMIVQIKLNEPYKFKLIGDYDHYLYEVNNEYHQITIRFNLK